MSLPVDRFFNLSEPSPSPGTTTSTHTDPSNINNAQLNDNVIRLTDSTVENTNNALKKFDSTTVSAQCSPILPTPILAKDDKFYGHEHEKNAHYFNNEKSYSVEHMSPVEPCLREGLELSSGGSNHPELTKECANTGIRLNVDTHSNATQYSAVPTADIMSENEEPITANTKRSTSIEIDIDADIIDTTTGVDTSIQGRNSHSEGSLHHCDSVESAASPHSFGQFKVFKTGATLSKYTNAFQQEKTYNYRESLVTLENKLRCAVCLQIGVDLNCIWRMSDARTLSTAMSIHVPPTYEIQSLLQVNAENNMDDNKIEDIIVDSNDGELSVSEVAIVRCKDCLVAVHVTCYGVQELEDPLTWQCRRCAAATYRKVPLMGVPCELCPNPGGAFMSAEGMKWVHTSCALFITESHFKNWGTYLVDPSTSPLLEEPVILARIPAERYRLKCSICKKNKGLPEGSLKSSNAKTACIQCHFESCSLPAFHVTCAQRAEAYPCAMNWSVFPRFESLITYCSKKHAPTTFLERYLKEVREQRELIAHPKQETLHAASISTHISSSEAGIRTATSTADEECKQEIDVEVERSEKNDAKHKRDVLKVNDQCMAVNESKGGHMWYAGKVIGLREVTNLTVREYNVNPKVDESPTVLVDVSNCTPINPSEEIVEGTKVKVQKLGKPDSVYIVISVVLTRWAMVEFDSDEKYAEVKVGVKAVTMDTWKHSRPKAAIDGKTVEDSYVEPKDQSNIVVDNIVKSGSKRNSALLAQKSMKQTLFKLEDQEHFGRTHRKRIIPSDESASDDHGNQFDDDDSDLDDLTDENLRAQGCDAKDNTTEEFRMEETTQSSFTPETEDTSIAGIKGRNAVIKRTSTQLGESPVKKVVKKSKMTKKREEEQERLRAKEVHKYEQRIKTAINLYGPNSDEVKRIESSWFTQEKKIPEDKKKKEADKRSSTTSAKKVLTSLNTAESYRDDITEPGEEESKRRAFLIEAKKVPRKSRDSAISRSDEKRKPPMSLIEMLRECKYEYKDKQREEATARHAAIVKSELDAHTWELRKGVEWDQQFKKDQKMKIAAGIAAKWKKSFAEKRERMRIRELRHTAGGNGLPKCQACDYPVLAGGHIYCSEECSFQHGFKAKWEAAMRSRREETLNSINTPDQH
eukprot:CFRG4612T1